MSYNIRNIREISNDPLTKFTNQLAKKLSVFLNKQQTDKLENKEDIYSDGQDIDVVLRFQSLNSTKYFDFLTEFYPPFEPDYAKLQLWIRGVNMGNTMRNWSETSPTKDIILSGDPVLVDGTPFDDGTKTGGTKSIALRFNRSTSPFVNTERIRVEEITNNRILGLATGCSIFIRFRVFSIATQGGNDRTLFEKIDDTTPNNAVKLVIKSNGKLQIDVRQGSADFSYTADTTTIATNTVYDVWVTYTVSGDVVKVYVNNVDQTLTPVSAASWHTPLTDHDFYIMHKGGTTSGGYVDGDLYDFRFYHEKVVSAAEVGYHYTNKWTISDIPFGQVIIANYWATYDEASIVSYTSASFTSTSYTM